jgi:glycogen synthase kinase 3 beta
MLQHPNCVEMRQSFYTGGDKEDEVYLNVVMDYIPDTAYRVMK